MLGDTPSELIEQYGSDTFKAVHDSDQDGLIYFNEDGTIEYVNRAAMRLFCMSSEDIIGTNILELRENGYDELPVELIHPSDHLRKARETYFEGEPNRSEMVIIDGDKQREIEVIWGPVERDGEVIGVVGSYRDITPRPDIHDQFALEESSLEEQRRFLASVIDVIEGGIIVFDMDASVVLVNPAAIDMLDLDIPPEGLELGALLDTIALHEPGQFADQLRQTASSESSTSGMHLVERADGSARRIDVRMIRGGPARNHVICMLSDDSKLIEVEQMELLSRVSEVRREPGGLDDMCDQIVELIAQTVEVDFVVLAREDEVKLRPLAWRGVLIDREMRLDLDEHPEVQTILESGRAKRLDDWSWRPEAGEGNVSQLVIPLVSDAERLGTLHLGALISRGESPFNSVLHTLDSAFTDALANTVSTAIENTELRERRATRQDRLESLLATIPTGVVLYDRRGNVLLANEAISQITGVDDWRNLNTDSRPYRLLDAEREPLPRSEWPIYKAVEDDTRHSIEAILDFGHSERDVSLVAAPLDENQSPAETFVGLIRDITEQRKIDRRKDEFLSIASHELRSPLTPLTGTLQLARRQIERGEEVDVSLLTRAERQVARLTRLIDGLLDLTRIETGRIHLETRAVDFRDFVEKRVKPWNLNPKDIDLQLSLPEESVPIEVDPERINQVITNVVDNAIKYSKSGEVIRIEVIDRGDDVVMGVEDDGVGMDEETVDHIFERFFHGRNVDGNRRSMGLGLYICRQIVEQHGGTIDVESTRGEGTRVEFALPKNLENEDATGDEI